jgi:hypothetical protein
MPDDNDAFQIERSVLVMFGYRSGVKGGISRQRRGRIGRTFRADLKKFLSPEDYEASKAGVYWGEPESGQRLYAICRCLAQPLHSWSGKNAFIDATKQRVEDLEYCRAELYSSDDMTWTWDFPTRESHTVAWAFQS